MSATRISIVKALFVIGFALLALNVYGNGSSGKSGKGRYPPMIHEAHIQYLDLSIPELSIIGENLCATRHSYELEISLGSVQLTDFSCQMLGTLDQPLDVIIVPLRHSPAPGNYALKVKLATHKKGIEIQFYLAVGAIGPAGIQGIQGIQGFEGPQGFHGLQGIQGTQGERGVIGPQGNPGPLGLMGLPGLQGAQGNQGDKGDLGARGEAGHPGLKGDDGLQGTKGNVGERGPSGIDSLASLVCPENHYLVGFQSSGALLCNLLLSAERAQSTDGDPDFEDTCFSFENTADVDITGNSWFDNCVNPAAVSLRILVKDNTGATIYDESATINHDWTENNITSTAFAGQHIFSSHDRLLIMSNNDRMIITGKSAAPTTGCFSSYANGYGIIIYGPDGGNNEGIRLLALSYEHGILGTPRNLSGWTASNEITFSAEGELNTCNGALMTDGAQMGSLAIFVK